MKKIGTYFLLFIFSLTLFSGSYCVSAEEKTRGFSINPFFQEVNLEKDQASADFNVEIENNTENLAVLKLSVLDFGNRMQNGLFLIIMWAMF